MKESERMDIVIALDDCVKRMRGAIGGLHDVTGSDLPEHSYADGDAFYNVCEAKLKQVRDMAQSGHQRLKIEWEHRNQMERDYSFDEHIKVEDPRGGTMIEVKIAKYDDDMKYSDNVLVGERAARSKIV